MELTDEQVLAELPPDDLYDGELIAPDPFARYLQHRLAAERLARREAYRWAAEQVRITAIAQAKSGVRELLNRLADRIEHGPTPEPPAQEE